MLNRFNGNYNNNKKLEIFCFFISNTVKVLFYISKKIIFFLLKQI